MLKGFCICAMAASLLVAFPALNAQVYRCEGPNGPVYSDMPCSDSAEEIAVEGMEPKAEAEAEAEAVPEASAAAEVPDQRQSYRNFLGVLNSQKLFKIGEVDRELTRLKETRESAGFEDLSMADQQRVMDQIADLELERETIENEYDGLIAEMERRIQTDDAIAEAQDQLN